MNLDTWLDHARRRLRRRFALRGAALVALCTLAVTAVAAAALVAFVPGSDLVIGARVLLYAGLAAAAAALILWPHRRDTVARRMEARIPAFGGRLVTWLDAERRGDRSPLFALLTRETTAIANGHPPDAAVPARELAAPAAAAAVAVVALGLLLFAGQHPWQLAGQRLWTGDLFAAAHPRIVVTPGNAVVPEGSDVIVNARGTGFVARDMHLSAAFDGGDWERAPMSDLGNAGYGFVFVAVGDDIEYYVAASGLSSRRYTIHVADLPTVTALELAYEFPSWTGLPAATQQRGDVAALEGTRVTVTAKADAPLDNAVLVVNGRAVGMATDGAGARGDFEVTAPGEWHLAVRHEGELARISDTYLITVTEDAPPEVAFAWPGHDRRATAIEEVALTFEAKDDYGVESLTMRYAVNGGDWVDVPLDVDSGEHVLPLETLTTGAGGEPRSLVPGDVISVHAEARDHTQLTRTALYFIDVRPFEKAYHESQRMSNGSRSGGGMDIAERQREIVTATWNLINKRDAGSAGQRALHDQADVIAMLQRTLAERVGTLLERSAARRLGADADIAPFVRELTRATEYMEPAAVKLDERAFEDAIPPEQQALRHLLTAEANIRDVNVSLSRGNARGTSGRSLSELIELEMDPERNRYEVPQSPTFGEGGANEQGEAWKRLEELAARQEQLARQQRMDAQSLASRWEQERLRRELEELRRELEARAQRSAGSRSDGAPGGAGLERAIADLDRARAELDRAAPSDSEARRRAGAALREAADALRAGARGNLENRLARADRRIENLLADQQRVMERLEQVEQETLGAARRGEQTPFRDFSMQTFSATKRRMQDDVSTLRSDLAELSEAIGRRDPDAARMLDRALDELDEGRIDERLAASADAFDYGRPLFVIGNEELVKRSLERLASRVQQARRQLATADPDEDRGPLARVRDLRRQLDEARDGGAGAVERIARATELLEQGVGSPLDLADDRASYLPRGTADENTEALYRMTRDRLDLIETALVTRDAPPIRAQEPRPEARDSDAAARYFRDLSAPDG